MSNGKLSTNNSNTLIKKMINIEKKSIISANIIVI